MSLRSELREAFKDYTSRNYRCSGKNCNFEMIAIEGIEIWCNTPNCRGVVTPRRKYPTSKMVQATMDEINGQYSTSKSPLQPCFLGVSSSQRAQKSLNVSLGATINKNACLRIAHMDVNGSKDYQLIIDGMRT